MKPLRCSYNDEGVYIPGILISCLWMKTFYPYDTTCGWSSQKINRKNKHLIMKG